MTVNGADRLYLVIESVRPDTEDAWHSTTPVPADGRKCKLSHFRGYKKPGG